MWISTLSTIVSLLVVLILNVNHVQALPRRTFRFRSKVSSSLPPFLTISPPRLTSPPKFHTTTDFDLPPFLMPSGPAQSMTISSFERPSMEYGPPPAQSYGPPSYQSYGPPPSQSHGTSTAEYGPPSSIKPMIHKHIYVHIPPPEPETPVIR